MRRATVIKRLDAWVVILTLTGYREDEPMNREFWFDKWTDALGWALSQVEGHETGEAALVWVCERCDLAQDGNPRFCWGCGYTVYRPTWPAIQRDVWR